MKQRADRPGVQFATDVLPWGIEEFAAKGADYAIYDYLETVKPDPAVVKTFPDKLKS